MALLGRKGEKYQQGWKTLEAWALESIGRLYPANADLGAQLVMVARDSDQPSPL